MRAAARAVSHRTAGSPARCSRRGRALDGSPNGSTRSAPGTAAAPLDRVPHTVKTWLTTAHASNDAKLLDGSATYSPGPLPVAAARGARRRHAGRSRRALPQKLTQRHPHIHSEPKSPPSRPRGRTTRGRLLRSRRAEQVPRNWDAIKAKKAGREPGIFGEVPKPPRCALRPQDPAARGVDRLRLRPHALRGGARPARS